MYHILLKYLDQTILFADIWHIRANNESKIRYTGRKPYRTMFSKIRNSVRFVRNQTWCFDFPLPSFNKVCSENLLSADAVVIHYRSAFSKLEKKTSIHSFIIFRCYKYWHPLLITSSIFRFPFIFLCSFFFIMIYNNVLFYPGERTRRKKFHNHNKRWSTCDPGDDSTRKYNAIIYGARFIE